MALSNLFLFIGLALIGLVTVVMLMERIPAFGINEAKIRNKHMQKTLIAQIQRNVRQELRRMSTGEKLIIPGTIFVLLSLTQTKSVGSSIYFGVIVGSCILYFLQMTKQDMRRASLAYEISELGDQIVIFVKTGSDVYTALQSAVVVTPGLAPHVAKCLRVWTRQGSDKALDVFEESVNIPEAQKLVLILKHLEAAGVANAQDVLNREMRNIRRLNEYKKQKRLTAKPVGVVVFKIFPFMALIGILIGAGLMKALEYIDFMVQGLF